MVTIWYTIPRKRRATGKTTPTGHPSAEGRKSPSAVAAVAPRRHASVSSVHRWYPTSLEEGLKGLRPRPTPGRPPGLSEWQKKKRVKGLLRGLQRPPVSALSCAQPHGAGPLQFLPISASTSSRPRCPVGGSGSDPSAGRSQAVLGGASTSSSGILSCVCAGTQSG